MMGLLLGNWKLIGLGLAGLAVAAFIGVHLAHDRHVVRERDDARAAALLQTINYGRCLINRAVLEGAVNAQSARVAALAAEGDRVSREAQIAAQRARIAVAAANRRAASIMAARPPADHCRGALDLIRGQGQ